MWLVFIAVLIVVLVVVGAVVSGGTFTIIAVPIVGVALLGGVFWWMVGRMALSRSANERDDRDVMTPGELADARRARQ